MMRYLLDTHTIIWITGIDDWKLSQRSKEIILSGTSDLSVSIISLWEIALKVNKGKLDLGITLDELIGKIQESRITMTPISAKHILGLSDLPHIHNDPFDRLLISTAIAENMTILTADENIQQYSVRWVW